MLYPNVNVKDKHKKRGKLKMIGEKPSQGEKSVCTNRLPFFSNDLGQGGSSTVGEVKKSINSRVQNLTPYFLFENMTIQFSGDIY